MTFANAGTVTAILPSSMSSLFIGCQLDIVNYGPGTVTLGAGSNTINNSASSISIAAGNGGHVVSSNGTNNYSVQLGNGAGGVSSFNTRTGAVTLQTADAIGVGSANWEIRTGNGSPVTSSGILLSGTLTTTHVNVVGKTILFNGGGIFSTATATPGSYQWSFNIGSTQVCPSAAPTPTTSLTTQGWVAECGVYVAVADTGSGATLCPTGMLTLHNSASATVASVSYDLGSTTCTTGVTLTGNPTTSVNITYGAATTGDTVTAFDFNVMD